MLGFGKQVKAFETLTARTLLIWADMPPRDARLVDQSSSPAPTGWFLLFLLLVTSPGVADNADVRFLRPPAGTPLFDEVDVEVAIESDQPVQRVELRFDGGRVGVLTEPPWRWTLDVGAHNRDRTLYVDVHTVGGHVTREELFAPRFESDDEIDLGLRQICATVTDRKGRRVLDLESGDFTLRDDGKRQDVVTFEHGDIPFTAVLLIDASGSMRGPSLATALRGARRFVRSLETYDEAKVMLFGERLLATTRWLGHDQADELSRELESVVSGFEGRGGSAIFDYLFLAMQRGETRHGRRAIILFGDGWDAHSVLTLEQIQEAVRRSQSQIYVIRNRDVEVLSYETRGLQPSQVTSLHTARRTRDHYRSLDELAGATGGRVLDIEHIDQVEAALQEVLRELREQYALGFYPSDRRGDGAWHEVKLSVAGAGLKVRTREGYVDD